MPMLKEWQSVTSAFARQTKLQREMSTACICKVAKNAQDVVHLVELGFECVTGEYDGGGRLFKEAKAVISRLPNLRRVVVQA
jgi:hypothetical protein